MIGSGTLVNIGAVLAGTGLGLLLKKGLPESMKKTVQDAIALSTTLIGLSGCISGLLRITEGGGFTTEDTMLLVGSLIVGAVIGCLLHIEDGLTALGEKVSNKFSKGDNSRFAQAFVYSTLIFCVGAMAVVGSLEDGLTGNGTTLYVKSILDGTFACIFTTTMGVGVVLSTVSIGVYQGLITLLASAIRPLLTDTSIAQMSMVGNALVLAIGFNLLGVTKIKVGNLLPATFLPMVFHLVAGFCH